MKQNDETARRVAHAMRRARATTIIPRTHLARLMNISTTQLGLYECGRDDVPDDILERIFTLGYMMMHVRNLNRYYMQMARMHVGLSAYRQAFRKKP